MPFSQTEVVHSVNATPEETDAKLANAISSADAIRETYQPVDLPAFKIDEEEKLEILTINEAK